jgi:alpha-beta hydrolase superfamily lysophospholipase
VSRHAYLARIFAENGYEFCGIDQLGFGHSGGQRGRVESLQVV